MERPCDECGISYTAQRASSRYCSPRCRMRASRRGASAPQGDPTPLTIAPPPVEIADGVEEATRVALVEAGREDSPLGRTALVLARRLDHPGNDTGSAIAAVAARLEATLAGALRGAEGETSPQALRNELAARRQRHA